MAEYQSFSIFASTTRSMRSGWSSGFSIISRISFRASFCVSSGPKNGLLLKIKSRIRKESLAFENELIVNLKKLAPAESAQDLALLNL